MDNQQEQVLDSSREQKQFMLIYKYVDCFLLNLKL